MNFEAFVYCWTNLDNGKKYIGYHKGGFDDGYVCSSKSDKFWNDWETCSWSRQIIAVGTQQECVKLEIKLLNKIDINEEEWYNNGRGGIVFTDEVRSKMSRKFSDEHKKKLSEAKKGRKLSPEHKAALHEGRRNSTNSAEHTQKIIEASKKRVLSDESRLKMSESAKKRSEKESKEYRRMRSKKAAAARWGGSC